MDAPRVAGRARPSLQEALDECGDAERYTLGLRLRWFPWLEIGFFLPHRDVGALGWLARVERPHLHRRRHRGHALRAAAARPPRQLISWLDELQVGADVVGAPRRGLRGAARPRRHRRRRPVDDRVVVDDVRFGYRAGRDVLHGVSLGRRARRTARPRRSLGRRQVDPRAPHGRHLRAAHRAGEIGGGVPLVDACPSCAARSPWSTRSTTSSSARSRDNLRLAPARGHRRRAARLALGGRRRSRGPTRCRPASTPRSAPGATRWRRGSVPAARAGAAGARRPAHARARRGHLAARPPCGAAPRALAGAVVDGPHRRRDRAPAAHRVRRRPGRRRRGRAGRASSARHDELVAAGRLVRRALALLARRRLSRRAAGPPAPARADTTSPTAW